MMTTSHISTATLPEQLLPQLPGYKSKVLRESARRKQFFSVSQGQRFMSDEAEDLDPLDCQVESTSLMTESTSRPKNRTTSTNFITYANQSLQWSAYFEEEVAFSGVERSRIRRCVFTYFLEDDTVSICEPRQTNSGLVQGTVLKRSRPLTEHGNPVSIEDIEVGKELTIYGRTYFIVDASPYTRRYLEREFERVESDAISVPDTEFEAHRRTQSRGIETALTQDFRLKKNEIKQYIEASVGTYVDNSRRAGFLKYGHNCLMFVCTWDDTESLYGDKQFLKLIYHLADDTIEVFTMRSGVNNTSRSDAFKLLKRCKLPYDQSDSSRGNYHWSDFGVGSIISLFARNLQIIDADGFTRSFYEENGSPLDDAIRVTAKPVTKTERLIPPYTGIGSEEDSLKSCTGHLGNKSPPKKRLGEDKILSFYSLINTGRPEDQNRNFIIQYFVIDNTVKILEPPQRNSGFVGGCFLARTRVRGANHDFMTANSFFVGARVRVAGNEFLLVDATESTLRYMEVRREKFPQSDITLIFPTVRATLEHKARSGELLGIFQQVDVGYTGHVSLDDFNAIMDSLEVNLSRQELLTLYRGFARRKDPLRYEKFISELVSPTADLF